MIDIGPLSAGERAGWEALFRDYLAFYGRTEPASMYEQAWRRFQDGAGVHALGARMDGALVGIAHFLSHPNTSAPGVDSCYLQDLFTAPAARGKGVARALIGAVREWAAEAGCGRLYWHTQDTNATARRLYDQVADHRGFIVYQVALTPPGGGAER
ncbi:N-acetyltransferase family protein [Nonomuraea sp. ATR24]|uniref:GNAT family N-acetyltransferase n=1 Tax=Nonomuraea TaxID=83681 RepID=UPI001C5EED99|nr:GNAT family N-acetyltransferase [Nonomuraea ceibae]